ncbi:MAG: hypothetical protein ACOX9C_09185 [Kiritimatiellia bacterium]|jgi:hypothetical protein
MEELHTKERKLARQPSGGALHGLLAGNPIKMIMRTVLVMAVVSTCLLCSCTKDGKALDSRLAGEWMPLNEPADPKRIHLGADGDASFVNIRGDDVGVETHELLSVNGSWTLSPNGKLLRMKFVLGGAIYEHAGRIVHERSGLEIWFSVGDPDDNVWRRFRKRDTRATEKQGGVILVCADQEKAQASEHDRLRRAFMSSSRSSTSVAELERSLGLRDPEVLRWPTMADPLWWFGYKSGGLWVEVAANTEHPVASLEEANRTEFFFTGYFKIEQQQPPPRPCRVCTHPIPKVSASPDTAAAKFLREYDLAEPISIRGVERALGLGAPYRMEPPAFIDPMWRFFYTAKDCDVQINGRQLLHDGTDSNDTADYLFTGYWAVIPSSSGE